MLLNISDSSYTPVCVFAGCFTKRDHLPPHTGWACLPACQKSETGTSPAWGSGRRWSPAGPTAAASWSWRWCCGRGSGGWSCRLAHTLEGALQVQPERQHKHWMHTKTVSTNDQNYGRLSAGHIVNCGLPLSSWSVFKRNISNWISKLIKNDGAAQCWHLHTDHDMHRHERERKLDCII